MRRCYLLLIFGIAVLMPLHSIAQDFETNYRAALKAYFEENYGEVIAKVGYINTSNDKEALRKYSLLAKTHFKLGNKEETMQAVLSFLATPTANNSDSFYEMQTIASQINQQNNSSKASNNSQPKKEEKLPEKELVVKKEEEKPKTVEKKEQPVVQPKVLSVENDETFNREYKPAVKAYYEGEYEQAIEKLSLIRNLKDPQALKVYILLAKSQFKLSRYNQVVATVDKFLAIRSSSESDNLYEMQTLAETAKKEIEAGNNNSTLESDEFERTYEEALSAYKLGKYEEVIKKISRVGSIKEKHELQAYVLLTKSYFVLNEFEKALEYANDFLAIRSSKQSSEVQVVRGLVNEASKKVTHVNIADPMPQPFGGIEAIYEYIGENVKYPAKAAARKVSGKVYIKFVVNTNGSISQAEIVKGIGSGCDEEALQVVRSLPDWKPGLLNGKPVRVQMTLPVVFKIGS